MGLVTYFNASGHGEFAKEISDTNSRIASKNSNIQSVWRIAFKYILTGAALIYMTYFSIYLINIRVEKSTAENIMRSAQTDDLCITIESLS